MLEGTSGIRFKWLFIQNGRVFKSVKVPLEKQGLVSILGKIGAGKTTLWDILESIFFGSTPGKHKKDTLTKNTKDSHFQVGFEKNMKLNSVNVKRKKKKWSYHIESDNVPKTPHSFVDGYKKAAEILGLTKAEFEGSVHLTQNSQHILISGSPSQRREYISGFFGIDSRYDEVLAAAKKEQEIVTDKISKLGGLSHSKQIIESELANIKVTSPERIQNKLKVFQTQLTKLTDDLEAIDKSLNDWQLYDENLEYAKLVNNPHEEIAKLEKRLIRLNSLKDTALTIKRSNAEAKSVNKNINQLEATQKQILTKFPNIEEKTYAQFEKEYETYKQWKHQDDIVKPLREELAAIPDVKLTPIHEIESELTGLQVDYQFHLKRKRIVDQGKCGECGSTFQTEDADSEKEMLAELKEAIDILNEDYVVVKQRNKQAERRKFILDTIAGKEPFTDHDSLASLQALLPAKRTLDDIQSSLKIMKRVELQEEIDESEILREMGESQEDLKDLKLCARAQEILPEKPEKSKEDLQVLKSSHHNQISQINSLLASSQQKIGEILASNESHKRLQKQLSDIEEQLNSLEQLKREEFFWNQMVAAYGPRGLRIQQLEKMMDLIIQRLPVYTNVLFDEKDLTFTYKLDANNIEIIACRKELDEKGEVKNSFEHDISTFSGGEKSQMSTSFVLTLADCVPAHKRANILILDEIDSALDEAGRYRFINDLLPMLKVKYESVFVLSHSSNVQQASIYDQVWTITKNNHWSEIEMQSSI